MRDAALQSEERAMNRLIINIMAIQWIFPVIWDPLNNRPIEVWPDRLGLIGQPENAWQRIQQNFNNLAGENFNGQANAMQQNYAELWDAIDENPNDALQNRLREDERRSASPENDLEEPNIPLAVEQGHNCYGPIGKPQLGEEQEEDSSDAESEFEDDWDLYYDSGIDTDSDTESNFSMDQEEANPDYIDVQHYCPACDRVYILRHYEDNVYKFY